jgi:hypothetical protein
MFWCHKNQGKFGAGIKDGLWKKVKAKEQGKEL